MADEPLDLFAAATPVPPSSGAIDLTAYRQRLAAPAAQGIYIGNFSLKYPGWCGMIYDEGRYLVRQ